jgi:uncharacterized Zn finger protein (UPF0148 family)
MAERGEPPRPEEKEVSMTPQEAYSRVKSWAVLWDVHGGGNDTDSETLSIVAHALSLLDAYAALKEENERLRGENEKMKPACLTCFGTGKIQTRPTVICPKCGGTGKEWSVAWKARAEKAETENERLAKRLREEFATAINNAEEMREWKVEAGRQKQIAIDFGLRINQLKAENVEYRATNEKYWKLLQEREAELEAQRPLVEAVMAVPKDYVSMCPYIGERDDYWHDVHRAALAYKSAKGE